MEKLFVFDTTLRDGEQSPGCKMDVNSKMIVARQLSCLGVDVIEAGFPFSSSGDFEAVSKISKVIKNCTICALARTKKEDIESAVSALKDSSFSPRIHIFVGTSKIHLKSKLRKLETEILDMISSSVELAKRYVDDVEFSPEDAARTGIDFLKRAIRRAIDSGATVINVPDTVGYGVGLEYRDIIDIVVKKYPEIIVSTHCHNDLGQAVGNTLLGVIAGARQVECCMLGIGERAGNAQLEAVAMSIKTRSDYFKVKTNIKTEEIGKTARLVSSIIGKPISDNLPVVGRNVFSHGAGIHYDGVKKDRRTYEIMKPEEVGWEGTSYPLLKHSGRHALKDRLASLFYTIDSSLLEEIYKEFIVLADSKVFVTNFDLHLIVQEVLTKRKAKESHLFSMKEINYKKEGEKVEAEISISKNGELFSSLGFGDGPVSAVWNATISAVSKIISPLTLKEFNVEKGSGGVEALGLVTLKIESGNKSGYGKGSDTDIVIAFGKALVSAINHLLQVPANN